MGKKKLTDGKVIWLRHLESNQEDQKNKIKIKPCHNTLLITYLEKINIVLKGF